MKIKDVNDVLNTLNSGKISPNLEEKDYILKEIVLIAKDIYTSRDVKGIHPPKYLVSNEQLEMASKRVAEKYDLKTIQNFYNYVKKRDLCGKSNFFSLTKFDEDIENFLTPEQKIELTPFQQSNRYMHLIYAPNIVGQDILETCDNPTIIRLTKMAMKKFGPKAIEILMDYKLSLYEMGRFTDDFNVVCSDIKEAIK